MIHTLCPCRASTSLLPTSATSTATPSIQCFHSAHEVAWEDWEKLLSEGDLLLGQAYLSALEQSSRPEIQPYYVLIYEGNEPVFLAYFQLVSFSARKIKAFTPTGKADLLTRSWPTDLLARLGSKLAQTFSIHLLLNGNSLITGDWGFRAAAKISPTQSLAHFEAALQHVQELIPHLGGTLIKDLPSSHVLLTEWLNDQGYHSISPEPDMRLPLSSDWEEFVDYQNALSSKYRQRLRSAYKKSQPIETRELTLPEVKAREEELMELFQQVIKAETFAISLPSSTYLSEVKAALGEHCQILGYFEADQLLGFSLLLGGVNGGSIAHLVGVDQAVNRDKKLYLRMLYDQISQSLEAGVAHLALGRTASTIKSSLGAEAHELPSYLHLRAGWANRLAPFVIQRLALPNWEKRNPFKQNKAEVSPSIFNRK